jgi:hypothetical protein
MRDATKTMISISTALLVLALSVPGVAQEEDEKAAEEAAGVEAEPVEAEPVEAEPVEAGGESHEAGATETEAEKASSTESEEVKIPLIVDRIKELQKQIQQSQERMDEIVGIVLNTADTKGAKAVISLVNGMSGSFVPIQAVVSLDGAPIFKKSDEDGILTAGEVEVFNGAILPGEHTLSVLLVYRGAGYGIFSYLQGYRFKVRSSTKFKVKEDKGIRLEIIGYEKGDQDTKMEDRPAIKYTQEKMDID